MGTNQYTKARENGEEVPPGANQFTTGKRTEMEQGTKDAIRAELAAQFLENVMTAKRKPKSDQSIKVAAAKALLPYGKPALQSIEQTTADKFDDMNEEGLKDYILALIRSKPELLAPIRDALTNVSAVQPDNEVKVA